MEGIATRNEKSLIKGVLISCLFLALFQPALSSATPISIEAFTDKTKIKMGERLTLTIKIWGEVSGSFPTPSTPSHDGFDIIGPPYQSSSFSWVDGRVSSTKTVTYTLIPHSTGTFLIGRATINFRGDTYTTKPVEVTVEEAPEPSLEEEEDFSGISADPYGRIMVSASIDKSQVYVGEPVLYTFSFFRNVRFWEPPQYYPPDFTDFWVEDLPRDDKAREVLIRGKSTSGRTSKRFSSRRGRDI